MKIFKIIRQVLILAMVAVICSGFSIVWKGYNIYLDAVEAGGEGGIDSDKGELYGV